MIAINTIIIIEMENYYYYWNVEKWATKLFLPHIKKSEALSKPLHNPLMERLAQHSPVMKQVLKTSQTKGSYSSTNFSEIIFIGKFKLLFLNFFSLFGQHFVETQILPLTMNL